MQVRRGGLDEAFIYKIPDMGDDQSGLDRRDL